MEITDVRKYITENEERFLNELISLLKIPSVSADSAYDKDTQRCAEHVKQSLLGRWG